MPATAGIILGDAVLGGIGSGLSARSQRRAQEAFNKAQRDIFERQIGFTRKARKGALKALSPAAIARFQAAFRRNFGNELQATLGQNIQNQVDTQLGRRGLVGTGIGTALSAGAAAGPGIIAFRQALQASQQLAGQRANAFLGTSTTPQAPQQVFQPTPNPIVGALQGGLAAGNVFNQLNRQPTNLVPKANPLLPGEMPGG